MLDQMVHVARALRKVYPLSKWFTESQLLKYIRETLNRLSESETEPNTCSCWLSPLLASPGLSERGSPFLQQKRCVKNMYTHRAGAPLIQYEGNLNIINRK